MFVILDKKRLSFALLGIFLFSFPWVYKSVHPTQPREVKKPPYGKYLTWQEANELVPRFAILNVTDIETGLQFCVQRRAGHFHADVQPLTAGDTAVMKKIYAGRWSWKRRAVIVQTDDGVKIAASMNGMPHGQGAIKDNQFNGHFCIHFAGSKTHGSRKVDLAHQMMIWKAAGILDQQLKTLTAEKTIEVFVTALHQGDKTIATRMITSRQETCWKILKDIEAVWINAVVRNDQDQSWRLQLRVKYRTAPSAVNQTVMIKMHKTPAGWKIAPEALLDLHVQ